MGKPPNGRKQSELIARLFTAAARPPDRVVCSSCLHGPGAEDVQHNYEMEGTVCLWLCGHEVAPGDPRCYCCQPMTEAERQEPPF